ncbi:MAG: hypothetical protein GY940_47820 [bacterium]|nr:hypothetical protein [bacterium]
MSDVSKLRRSGGSPFPSVRKSADPFQPEMGEIDFAQQVEEVDSSYSTSVQEPTPTEQTLIHEEQQRKQYRQRKRKRKKEEDDEDENESDDKPLIDLQA